jgi:trans-2-enoyl-CoA reductase
MHRADAAPLRDAALFPLGPHVRRGRARAGGRPRDEAGCQASVAKIWPDVTTENLAAQTDIAGYRSDFLKLFGFGVAGINYDAEIEPHIPMA